MNAGAGRLLLVLVLAAAAARGASRAYLDTPRFIDDDFVRRLEDSGA